MRLKLGLVIFVVVAIFALLTNFYIINTLENDSILKLEKKLVKSYQIYSKAHRATTEDRLDVVRKFSKEADLINALNMPSESERELDERHFKLFEILEVQSRIKYFGDMFLVLDAEGIEQARTQVAAWRKNNWKEKPLVKNALQGGDGEDIWTLSGKPMLLNATPIRQEKEIIGVLLMANILDEDIIKQENALTSGHFAIFSKNKILASTLSSVQQNALGNWVKRNSAKIAQVLLSKNDYFEERLTLEDERFIIILSPIFPGNSEGLAGFMIVSSVDEWIKEYGTSRNFLLILAALLALLAISASFLIIQKAYDAIDFILEGAHQIIMGNKEYEFASEDSYLNQLGQTINLMIAILLGKYIPEDEEEAGQASMRGSLSMGRGAPSQDRMLIESLEDEQKEGAGADEVQDEDSYFDRLFEEFLSAKRDAGEDISQITKERMIQKLKRAEQKMISKHGCKGVRFAVKVEKGKVTLKPSPIWN